MVAASGMSGVTVAIIATTSTTALLVLGAALLWYCFGSSSRPGEKVAGGMKRGRRYRRGGRKGKEGKFSLFTDDDEEEEA